MALKNYYKILDLPYDASQEEIKRGFRQLALLHHPDKNNGDHLAELRFKEIQEAYHTLSDPSRRAAYNQKRWYAKHGLRKDRTEPVTAYQLFSKSNELAIYVRQLRPPDINKKPLFDYIRQLLDDDDIGILKRSDDAMMNKEIVIRLLEASDALSPLEKEFIALRLQSIADKETIPLVQKRLKETARARLWERWQFLFIFMLTLLLCWMIYLWGN